MTSSLDFHVENSVGKTVFTSPDKSLAKRWADENSDTFPGLIVVEVVTTVLKRRVYRPRPLLSEVAA